MLKRIASMFRSKANATPCTMDRIHALERRWRDEEVAASAGVWWLWGAAGTRHVMALGMHRRPTALGQQVVVCRCWNQVPTFIGEGI